MKLALLDGNPGSAYDEMDAYLGRLCGLLTSRGHDLIRFVLRDMDLKYCTGCWDCWVKTPGECSRRDDTKEVRQAVMKSDMFVLASPVIMGFTSALLKRAHEKLIPLVHPYFELVQGEVHHRARYSRYPLMGLILHTAGDTDRTDIEIITEVYRRDAINLRTRLGLVRATSDPVEEVADEIDRVQRIAPRPAQ